MVARVPAKGVTTNVNVGMDLLDETAKKVRKKS
jgi:hypothetical protein